MTAGVARLQEDVRGMAIYICYGVTKSASTFLYQLIEEVLAVAGRRPMLLRPPLLNAAKVENYFDNIDPALLRSISEQAGDRDVVLKTHQRVHPGVATLIEAGTLFACASIRDPRELALSMLDHGRRTRRLGVPEFSEFHDLNDTLGSIDSQFKNVRSWSALKGVRVFSFNRICFDTSSVVNDIAAQIGVEIRAVDVLRPFRNKGLIGLINKGVALRYVEMEPEQQAIFLRRFASIYEEFSFDAPVAERAAIGQLGKVMRPRSDLGHKLTRFRRRVRRIIVG